MILPTLWLVKIIHPKKFMKNQKKAKLVNWIKVGKMFIYYYRYLEAFITSLNLPLSIDLTENQNWIIIYCRIL